MRDIICGKACTPATCNCRRRTVTGQADALDERIERTERQLAGLLRQRSAMNRLQAPQPRENAVQRLRRLQGILDRA